MVRPAIESGRASPARGHALRVAAVLAAAGRDAVASHHGLEPPELQAVIARIRRSVTSPAAV